MLRFIAACLVAHLLLAPSASAQRAGSPLCKIGSSAIELLQFSYTTQFDPIDLRSSIVFLAECPSSIIVAFKAATAPTEPTTLQGRWIRAAQTAARDSSGIDLRVFLAEAQAAVERLGDSTLNAYLDGLFDGLTTRPVKRPALDSLLERQALAVLREYAECGAAACYSLSDNMLFLLGTHPMTVLRAMHTDSADATKWLSSLADGSFSGVHELRDSREAARRKVLATLSETWAPGFERERRACENALRKVRYRVVE